MRARKNDVVRRRTDPGEGQTRHENCAGLKRTAGVELRYFRSPKQDSAYIGLNKSRLLGGIRY